ncbi:MAG: protein-methionine-sulfoxide reductase catalytic subunit MsrP [Rhodothermales bacterium]|nr:protein-methionine-sulfoxide reductase catalytic subunit MsrP [Rhodothermales bacterium]
MPNIVIRPAWALKESDSTDKSTYESRRTFMRRLGTGTIGLVAVNPFSCGDGAASRAEINGPDGPLDTIPANATRVGYPATRSESFVVPERQITERITASSYNNFYEFDGSSKRVWPLTGEYKPFPWTIEVRGLVEKPLTLDVDELIRTMPLEERVYRFRCVEAWSMTIPWTGFPLKKLIDRCKPLSSATHVRFVSAKLDKQMPGIPSQPWYPWPYYEGLRMDEAINDLGFVATGMYGEPLTKQNGSPLRLALPWKYGYKGPKAVVRIEFTRKQPKTFWNELQPAEYSFLSNVNPNVPHPRWTQASERFMANSENIRRVPTQLFNGYADWVGNLYPGEPRG